MTELIFGEKEENFIPDSGALVYCPSSPCLIKIKADGKSDALFSLLKKYDGRRILSDTLCTTPSGFKVKKYSLYTCKNVIIGKEISGSVKVTENEDVLPLITSMYEESTGNTLSSSQAQQLFGNEKRNVWLWSDGGLCALIRIAFVGQHSARINTLYTVKEKRGHGYASALVYSVSRMLNEMGLCVTVLADNENPASNKTYQSLGFVKKADVFEYMPDASAPLHSALTYFTDLELPL